VNVRRRVPTVVALAVAVFAVLVQSAAASPSASLLKLHVRRLPYALGEYPMTSGNYALLSLGSQLGAEAGYVIIDDKTHEQTRLTAPSGCQAWGSAPFAVPWLVFSCVQGSPFRIYNVESHHWRALPCGQACENTGVAAPEAFGSDWMEVNEEAYCDPRTGPCTPSTAFVNLATGGIGTFRPGPRRLLDLDSPTLTREVCAPLTLPPSGASLEFIGAFAVETTANGDVYLEKCGSRLHRLLNAARPDSGTFVTANTHAVVTCSDPGYGGGPRPTRYSGVFLPSLKRFTFDLPAGLRACGATLDNDALYDWDASESHVWTARFPTIPPEHT
jgi:hypothetical protein